MPNPHYTPEISTKVTIINFTLAPSGLEDQLLGRVVAQERPDLEEAKNQLIVQNASMKKELKEIEDEILQRLSDSQGNPVDDVDLISALEASNIKSTEIKAKVAAAEVTEKEIDETRMKYIPVAVRSQDRMETFPGFNIIVTFLSLFHGLHPFQDSILLCF